MKTYLEPCLHCPTIPALVLAPTGPRHEATREAAVRILQDLVPELHWRLSAPPSLEVRNGRREVQLWETVSLSVDASGRALHSRWVSGIAAAPPCVTLDLRTPVSSGGWIGAFLPVIALAARRHGVEPVRGRIAIAPWLAECLIQTFDAQLELETMRDSLLDFLAFDPLARSLAMRVFPREVFADEFAWIGERVESIALTAVEEPAMIPFLAFAQADSVVARAKHPLAALRSALREHGLEASACRNLARWEFAPFDHLLRYGDDCVAALADLLGLLHRLEVCEAPSAHFVQQACFIGKALNPEQAFPDFSRAPDWFMHSLLRACEGFCNQGYALTQPIEVASAVDWLINALPEPTAHERNAGWSWIAAQARKYESRAAPSHPPTMPVLIPVPKSPELRLPPTFEARRFETRPALVLVAADGARVA